MQKSKLSVKLNSAYRAGWRVYRKQDIDIPVVEMREMLPMAAVAEDENFPSLVFIRDKKFWEFENEKRLFTGEQGDL